MFSTYRPHLRNGAYLWTHLPVCHGEMTSLPISNHAASYRLTLAAVSSYMSPMICQGEEEDHRHSCPAAIQSWFNDSVMEWHPWVICRSIYVPVIVGNITHR